MRPASVALIASAALVIAGCGGPSGSSGRREPTEGLPSPAERPVAPGPQLINPDWQIVRMGTAGEALVIEVEADDPARSLEIARLLIEPVHNRYKEVLVYVRGRAAGASTRVKRVQWTPSSGLVETSYERE